MKTIPRKLSALLKRAQTFRGNHSVGSIERFAGIRNREALWWRASRLARGAKDCQVEIDIAMGRCRRLAALRAFRAMRSLDRAA